ncbi:hydroxyethylthiazole kinase [Furfurilactobacillus curtus]|uniref:Hydroxyethylthiazole kinase n=1 Tax=Furfurilactobacillus curtus TaxID=1746200 RepID=A0ABQ5JRB1_9LACO
MNPELLAAIRRLNPVVLTVANAVTIAEVANAVNAIGASPIMSKAPEEAPELVGLAGGVTLNLGTWTKAQVDQMVAVGQAANQAQVPVVIDPVAVALPKRQQIFTNLVEQVQPSIIRANAGEMAFLAGEDDTTRGIDATDLTVNHALVAAEVAKRFNCIAVMTGKKDFISDGTKTFVVHNGTTLFATHVGSGDMLSSVLGAFLAVSEDALTAAVTGTAIFAATGQWVAQTAQLSNQQPGTFAVKLMDGLAAVSMTDLKSLLEVEVN